MLNSFIVMPKGTGIFGIKSGWLKIYVQSLLTNQLNYDHIKEFYFKVSVQFFLWKLFHSYYCSKSQTNNPFIRKHKFIISKAGVDPDTLNKKGCKHGFFRNKGGCYVICLSFFSILHIKITNFPIKKRGANPPLHPLDQPITHMQEL